MNHASIETGGKTQYEYTRKWIVNVVMADSDISLLIFFYIISEFPKQSH